MAIIKKTDNNNIGNGVEKLEFSCIPDGLENATATVENSLAVPQDYHMNQ